MAAVVLLSTLAGIAAAQPRRVETLVDAIVAVVGGDAPGPGVDAILLSDVELRARLSLPVPEEGPVLVPLPAPLLAATLEQLVAERLIEREARRLRAPAPSSVAVLGMRRRMIAAAGGERAVARLLAVLRADPSELTEEAGRRAQVDSFLRGNLEMPTTVTEGAVDDAMARLDDRRPEAALEERADEPAEERRERVRAELTRRALQRGVRRFVEALRARSVVRIFRLAEPSAAGARGRGTESAAPGRPGGEGT